jgi:hypothetical protein
MNQDFGERNRVWPNGDFDGWSKSSAGAQKSVSRHCRSIYETIGGLECSLLFPAPPEESLLQANEFPAPIG